MYYCNTFLKSCIRNRKGLYSEKIDSGIGKNKTENAGAIRGNPPIDPTPLPFYCEIDCLTTIQWLFNIVSLPHGH